MARDFDALRAEIWLLADRRDLSESELIQKLLDTVGPALGLCRACFNEPDEDGMSCTMEWVRPGVRPSLGSHLPRVVQNALVRPYPTEFNLSESIDMLPAWVRPVGAPLLRALGAALDVESVLVVPYSIMSGAVDGVLTFDMSFGHGAKKGWSEPLRPVIYELALIVAQAIARRRAEQALSTAHKRFKALLQYLGEGVGLLGINEVFAFANPASEQIFGVGPGGLVGRSLGEFVDEEAWRRIQNQTLLRRGGLGKSTYQLQIRRGDRSVRWLEVTCTPEVEADDPAVATVAVFRDVTEERAAQRERQRVEAQVQLAQRLESLGVLSGGIAHDFNNVLAAIVAHAELALQQLPDSHEARESVEQIRSSAQQSSQLTRQLLTYAGKRSPVSEQVDVSRLVADVSGLLRTVVSKMAELRVQLAPSLPPVDAEPGQIRQVVMNLLTNASEALGNHAGLIEVTTGAVQLRREDAANARLAGETTEGSFVFLEVRDTGCGMSPEAQAQMFDPFFTTKFVGRGLGLAAVHGIVRAHRGLVFVESTRGKGTCVRVCLPVSTAPPRVASSPAIVARATAAATGGLVLVVDDEAAVRSSISRLLGRSGFRTIGAADGLQAVDVFQSHSAEISVVLLDMTMPGQSGAEVLASIRARRPRVPVILCSGYSEDELELPATESLLTAFMQKPFAYPELLKLMQQMIAASG